MRTELAQQYPVAIANFFLFKHDLPAQMRRLQTGSRGFKTRFIYEPSAFTPEGAGHGGTPPAHMAR